MQKTKGSERKRERSKKLHSNSRQKNDSSIFFNIERERDRETWTYFADHNDEFTGIRNANKVFFLLDTFKRAIDESQPTNGFVNLSDIPLHFFDTFLCQYAYIYNMQSIRFDSKDSIKNVYERVRECVYEYVSVVSLTTFALFRVFIHNFIVIITSSTKTTTKKKSPHCLCCFDLLCEKEVENQNTLEECNRCWVVLFFQYYHFLAHQDLYCYCLVQISFVFLRWRCLVNHP